MKPWRDGVLTQHGGIRQEGCHIFVRFWTRLIVPRHLVPEMTLAFCLLKVRFAGLLRCWKVKKRQPFTTCPDLHASFSHWCVETSRRSKCGKANRRHDRSWRQPCDLLAAAGRRGGDPDLLRGAGRHLRGGWMSSRPKAAERGRLCIRLEGGDPRARWLGRFYSFRFDDVPVGMRPPPFCGQ